MDGFSPDLRIGCPVHHPWHLYLRRGGGGPHRLSLQQSTNIGGLFLQPHRTETHAPLLLVTGAKRVKGEVVKTSRRSPRLPKAGSASTQLLRGPKRKTAVDSVAKRRTWTQSWSPAKFWVRQRGKVGRGPNLTRHCPPPPASRTKGLSSYICFQWPSSLG